MLDGLVRGESTLELLYFPESQEESSSSPETRYEIQGKIASGSEAEIFKVFDKIEKDHKVLRKQFLNQKRKRYCQMLEKMISFNHDNIIRFLDYYFAKSYINVIMEMGEATLRKIIDDKIETKQIFSETEILLLIEDLLSGLKFLSSKDILYVDLKPSNIVIKNGRWKLIDIPLESNNLTTTLPLIGTPIYACPAALYEENDIYKEEYVLWSFCIIIFEVKYLQLPYFVKDIMPLSEKVELYHTICKTNLVNDQNFFLLGYDISPHFKNMFSKVFALKSFNELEDLIKSTQQEISSCGQAPIRKQKILLKAQDFQEKHLSVPFQPFQSFKIAWHDQNIENEENSLYLENFSKNHTIKAFNSSDDTNRFLKACEDDWFVVTSGNKGEILIPMVHNLPQVIGIIIFCRWPQFHKTWASKYKKVIRIVNEDFSAVVGNIKSYF